MATAAPPNPPGPKGKPVVGSIPEFRRDILQTMIDGRTACTNQEIISAPPGCRWSW